MTSPRGSVAGADPWAAYEWVVWQAEVLDPEQRISEPYFAAGLPFLLAKDSREAMVDFAHRLGCIYEGCRDDGTFGSENDPCYAWCFRVPQALHAQRNARGWPLAMEECQQQLNRLVDGYPSLVAVDARRTRALKTGKPLPSLP
ncbi:hypothetical protein M2271_008230 [Streptomyces sp. LBL]|uniref:hypothetical protein n=1 Tax=Streptomyces sp. LBL TaxID=2940562 RepID=UPI00247447F3|nr:hypothetical protein [Streptomyces sp. LBL]MDH6630370.1 hypothetical protein [Streptomyces sp. LBL]